MTECTSYDLVEWGEDFKKSQHKIARQQAKRFWSR